jgi:signal transduction histidine kinase
MTPYQIAIHILKNEKTKIKATWEKRIRKAIPETHDNTSFVIQNSLDIFLDELATKLEQQAKSDSGKGSQEGMSALHGRDRAALAGYFLPQLLKEFSVLRQVLNEELHRQGALTYEIRCLIDESVDRVISSAATEFTSSRQHEMKNALSQAESSNRDLDQFASVAAHDLKSPLSTIAGFVEILHDEFADKLGTEGKEYLKTIQGAAERMRSLIDSILDYSRLSTPDKALRPTDMNKVVATTVANLDKVIAETNASITYEKLPVVLGDVDFLNQLFQNLISNSLKFRSENPPQINIHAEAEGAMWKFTVEDNGIGFDPKFKDEIFDLYKKLHGTDRYKGSGIGLATCRRVVELHGGKIWADSTLGHGSKFYFTLRKP